MRVCARARVTALRQGMCGRAYSPRMMWMWPNAKIGVMGGEQAAGVLTQVRQAGAAKGGAPLSDAECASYREGIRARYEAEASAYYATARLWDDGVIDPVQTRDVLGLSLAACLEAPIPETPRFGVFRM